MAFEPTISNRLDVTMNVNALRLVDPSLNQLEDHATHVVLYSFKPETNEWEKINIEGALFIYSRSSEPRYNMTVVNRLNTNNLVEPLNRDMNLQVQEPFLLYRNGDARIFGIWFYNAKECARISNTLDRIIKELNKNCTKNGVENVMSLLSLSEGPHRGPGVKVPDGTSKRVLDFFAMAKNTTPCQPPGKRKGSLQQRSEAVKPQADVKPLLQRLLSNPNQPVKTVEQIEKQHMSTPPKKEPTAPVDMVKSLDRVQSDNYQVVSKAGGGEKMLEKEMGFMRIADSNDSPPGVEALDRPGSSAGETPSKVPLFTPNMFMTGLNDADPLDLTVPAPDLPSVDLDIRPEPLTKAQLLQAVSYLLKNDPDFVNKLHQAYVKSFADRVS